MSSETYCLANVEEELRIWARDFHTDESYLINRLTIEWIGRALECWKILNHLGDRYIGKSERLELNESVWLGFARL